MAKPSLQPTQIQAPTAQVVPTNYLTLWGWRTHTHQYSVTEYYQRVRPQVRVCVHLLGAGQRDSGSKCVLEQSVQSVFSAPHAHGPCTHQPLHAHFSLPTPMQDHTLPGLFFLYDSWPIAVTLRQTRPGLLRLLVRLCAVVGGAFAVTGVVDGLVHRSIKAMGQKVLL
jgi:hypothetical protein